MMKQKRNSKGFTLVEIMIVVVLIGMLATIAIPAFEKVVLHVRSATIVNDIRVYAGAFQSYALANGEAPPQASSNALPVEMNQWIETTNWNDGASNGATWQYWNPYRDQPTVTLYQAQGWSDDLMILIEKKIDDSNLTGGMIQRSGRYIDYFWNEIPD